MAEQQRPSDRIISNVNTNTNGQVGDLKKYVAGVDPHISGPKNPDGTFSKTIAKNTQTPTQTSQEQKKEKQQMGVFQLLTRSVEQIKNLLNKIIKKQQPILDQQNQQRFIDELVKKISPELFGKIKIEPIQLKTFFTNITTISNSLTGLINSQDKLSNTLTNLNTTFADKFIPQFQNIDITSAISDKITGTFDVASAINSRIANETFSVASAINSKITDDKFNVASAINSKITDDTFNAASAINSKIVGEDFNIADAINNKLTDDTFNVAEAINSKITDDTFNVAKAIDSRITDDKFNIANAFDNKVTGTFDVSTIITPELLQSQIKEVFDTINLSIIDTFNFSIISEKLENKINDVIENINVSSIKTEVSSEVPDNGDISGGTTLDDVGKGDEKREQLEDKIENIKKALEQSLNNVFDEFLGKSQWIQDDVLPNIQYTLDESITKISKNIDNKLSNILNKLENIDNKIKPISEETTKEVADKKDNVNTQLEKIANSIIGAKDEDTIKGNASYTNDKGEKVQKQFAFTNKDVKTLRESQAEIIKAQANLDEVEDVDKFGENVKQADHITANILKEKSAFDNQAKFDKLLQTLEENANIKIDPKNLPKTRTERIQRIVKTMNPNTLSQKQLNRIASTLNKLNNNRAFNSDGKAVDKLTLTNKFGDDSKLIKDFLLNLKKDISDSKNPILNEKASKQDKLHFFNDKAKTVTSKGQRVDEIVKQVINKPQNFSLRNFLTSNGDFATLSDVLYSKLGKRIKNISQNLEELGEEEEKSEIERHFISSSTLEKETINNLVDSAKGEKIDTNSISDAITKGLGMKGVPGLGLGGGASGAGTFLGVGGAAGTALGIAGGALAAGTAGAGIYGAVNATRWDRQIGNVNGQALLGNTAVDGAFAEINHLLGRGFWSRMGTALQTGRWSAIWGKNNQLEDEYTEAEHKAQMSLGEDAAKQLQNKRQIKLVEDRVKEAREQNVHFGLQQTINKSIENFKQKQIGDINTSQLTNLNQEQLGKVIDTSNKTEKLLQYSQKMMVRESKDLNNASTILDTVDDKVLDIDKKRTITNMWNDILNPNTKFNDNELPETVRIQRKIANEQGFDLSKLSPKELDDIQTKLANFKFDKKWMDSSWDTGFLAKLKDGEKEKYSSYDKNDFRKHFLNYQNDWLLGIIQNIKSSQGIQRENIDARVKARVAQEAQAQQLPSPQATSPVTPSQSFAETVAKDVVKAAQDTTNFSESSFDRNVNRQETGVTKIQYLQKFLTPNPTTCFSVIYNPTNTVPPTYLRDKS